MKPRDINFSEKSKLINVKNNIPPLFVSKISVSLHCQTMRYTCSCRETNGVVPDYCRYEHQECERSSDQGASGHPESHPSTFF